MNVKFPVLRSLCGAILAATLASSAGAAQQAAQPLRFVDAHSHLLPNLTVDEEMAMFRKAGVTAVVIMSVPAEKQQQLAKDYRDYVVPFFGFARSRTSTQMPMNDETLATFAKLLDSGAMCGVGETGTMMDPAEAPAASLINPYYLKVFELANAHRAPVTYHVDLNTPEVIEAFGRVAGRYPRMPLIMAHAGFNAGPEVSANLLAAHPNIFVEVSIRLDPLNGFGDPPVPGPNGPDRRTMLDAGGALTPQWRKLMERYPDRFIFAMDIAPTGPKGRELRAGELTDIARKALSVLPRASQEAIAHGNIEKLLKGCASGPRQARS